MEAIEFTGVVGSDGFVHPPDGMSLPKGKCDVSLRPRMANGDQAKLPLQDFSNEQELGRIWYRQTRAGFWGAVVSITYMVLYNTPLLSRAGIDLGVQRSFAIFFLCLWAVGPAFWFAYETHWLISREDKQNKKERMAEFKVGQDAAKAFWVAVAALVALLFHASK